MQSHIKLNVCSIYNGRSAPAAHPGEGRYFEIGTPCHIQEDTRCSWPVGCGAARALPAWLLGSQRSVAPLNMLYCITMHVMHGSRKWRMPPYQSYQIWSFFTLGKFRRLIYFCLHSILSSRGLWRGGHLGPPKPTYPIVFSHLYVCMYLSQRQQVSHPVTDVVIEYNDHFWATSFWKLPKLHFKV